MNKIDKVRIEIGLEKPVHVAHITDVHLALADERNADLIGHAAQRTEIFSKEASFPDKTPEVYFKEAMDYAEKNCDATVITGDVIDFMSEANLDASDRVLAGRDGKYLFTAGNHEFCPRVGVPDSFARKDDYFAKIQSHYSGNMSFDSKIVGGVNLVAIDNGYYFYNQLQYDALKEEIKKGYPIILFSHVPLTDARVLLTEVHRDLVPDTYMKEMNKQMLDLIYFCPLIKAEISGHWHVYLERELPCHIPEYVTAGCFKGEFTELEIV